MRLKISGPKGYKGSSPLSGTNLEKSMSLFKSFKNTDKHVCKKFTPWKHDYERNVDVRRCLKCKKIEVSKIVKNELRQFP